MKLNRGSRLKASLVTTTYQMTSDDEFIYINDGAGSFTLTLLALVSAVNKRVKIKKTNSSTNIVTIAGLIDGVTNTTINTQHECLDLWCDGASWYIVSRFVDSSWKSFTPTGIWVTNATYTGMRRRVGDTVEMKMQVALSGAPTNTGMIFDLPTGYEIDTAKLTSILATRIPNLGSGVFSDSDGGEYALACHYNSTTTAYPLLKTASGTYATEVQSIQPTIPVTIASGDKLQVEIKYPVLYWK